MQYSASNPVRRNSIFPHFVMVIMVLWAELWFVVLCQALLFFSIESRVEEGDVGIIHLVWDCASLPFG